MPGISRPEGLERRDLLTAIWDGTIADIVKDLGPISSSGTLMPTDRFGGAVAAIGDLDGDGVADLAVGAEMDKNNPNLGNMRGSVSILFMNTDGTVRSATKIFPQLNGGPDFRGGDLFGASLAAVGDLDGDGNIDLAVGASRADAPLRRSQIASGAVHILYLNDDGTVKSSTTIKDGLNGGPKLFWNANFGLSVANIGDLNGDGITDLAVGANSRKGHRGLQGAVYALLMNSDGTVESSTKIANHKNGGPKLIYQEAFGGALTGVGDVNGDGTPDLAVGAHLGGDKDTRTGAAYVLFMQPDGHVKSYTRIGNHLNGGPEDLSTHDAFGLAVGAVGDLDGDGITELAVSSKTNNGPSTAHYGAVHILFLDSAGRAKSTSTIQVSFAGQRPLNDGNFFGISVTAIGDLNGDGLTELAVGALDDSTDDQDSYPQRGAVYVMFLNPIDAS